ncbi:MAG TPA: Fe-S protein assembly co-chaperone HscB [Gammaproteobacteria bacterium]|nr:Fe-S protein assembly co-chaperone HscB [Gammaproteobacteria bacterium]
MVQSSANYFELFKLPADFSLDLVDLKKRYLRLQSVVHPDKLAHRSELERRRALQQATLINDAYQTLKSPLLRAKYLLEFKLGEVNWEQGGELSMAFLTEQIQWREAIAAADSMAALEDLKERVKQQCQQLETELAQHFKVANIVRESAIATINQLQFMYKLLEEIQLRSDTA